MEPDATKLMVYMSELSEEAYRAGWMDGLEFALWMAVRKGLGSGNSTSAISTSVMRIGGRDIIGLLAPCHGTRAGVSR